MRTSSCSGANPCLPSDRLELEVAAPGNQDMAPGEHTGFVACQEGNGSRHIFRIEVLFKRRTYSPAGAGNENNFFAELQLFLLLGHGAKN